MSRSVGFDLQILGRYGKDGEDGDFKENFSNKTAIFMVKTLQFTTKCKIDRWVIALEEQKSK